MAWWKIYRRLWWKIYRRLWWKIYRRLWWKIYRRLWWKIEVPLVVKSIYTGHSHDLWKHLLRGFRVLLMNLRALLTGKQDPKAAA
jgi:hypothetical protein